MTQDPLIINLYYFLDLPDIAMAGVTNSTKKIGEASTTAMALTFSTGEYDLFIAYLLIHVLAIIVAIIDLTMLCLVRLIHLSTNMRLILLKYHQIYL